MYCIHINVKKTEMYPELCKSRDGRHNFPKKKKDLLIKIARSLSRHNPKSVFWNNGTIKTW